MLNSRFSRAVVAASITVLAMAATAEASQLVYRPVNPNFGGNPFNGAPLLANARAQFTGSDSGGQDADPISVFTRTLQARLLSQVSSEIVGSIFGEDAQDAGTFTVGDTSIQFERIGESVSVEIDDLVTGTSTSLQFPVLQAGN